MSSFQAWFDQESFSCSSEQRQHPGNPDTPENFFLLPLKFFILFIETTTSGSSEQRQHPGNPDTPGVMPYEFDFVKNFFVFF
jgi:hypothetical protein